MSDNDLNIYNPEPKKIMVKGQEFEIKPFVLRDRIKVTRIITEILAGINNNSLDVKSSQMLGLALVREAGEKLVEIYKIVLNVDEEWLQEIVIAEEVLIVKTIMEVNNLPFLMGEIRNLLKTPQN